MPPAEPLVVCTARSTTPVTAVIDLTGKSPGAADLLRSFRFSPKFFVLPSGAITVEKFSAFSISNSWTMASFAR